MRIAAGADDRTDLTDFVLEELRARGHELVTVLGPAGGRDEQWADVGRGVAEAVARGEADQGVVFCCTGTGVSLAANKVHGARAALCTDAEQARLVDQLEGMKAETQRLGSLYQRKLAALDELKKSLLHQAFSGQL